MFQNSNSSSSKEFQYLDINKRLVLCMPCNCYCISGSNNFSLPGMYRRALALCIDAWKLKLKNNWRNLIWNPPSCSVFTSHLQSPRAVLPLGDGVLVNGLSEGRPRGNMTELFSAAIYSFWCESNSRNRPNSSYLYIIIYYV